MIELLRKRRSVRKYQPCPVEPEKIELLKEALLRSPSSRNLDPWEFVLVQDPALLEKLSRSKPHGADFLKEAPLAIVVGATEAACDVWIEDCSIAAIMAQMTALSLGLGSCWVQIRKRMYNDTLTSEAYVRRLLGIPDTIRILSIIGIGYPAEFHQPVLSDRLKCGRIHQNTW